MEKYLSDHEYVETCGEILKNTQQHFKQLRDEIRASKRRISVGHYVSTPQQYFPSLAKAFKAHEDALDYRIFHSCKDPLFIASLEELGIKVTDASNKSAAHYENFDILFLQHPYYLIGDAAVDFYGIMRRLSEHILPRNYRGSPLLGFIPYAFTVIDERAHRPINGFHNLPIHNVAWKVFCETEWHLTKAHMNSGMKGVNWVCSGYPKLDEIAANPGNGDNLQGATDSNSVTIIWAPHHNPSFQGLKIWDVHMLLSKLVTEKGNVGVIFRPHPNVLNAGDEQLQNLGLQRKQFEEIVEFWKTTKGCSFDMGADLAALFERSTMMITDCGGFQAEYFSTGKPLVSYIKKSILNDFTRTMLDEAGYHVSSLADLSDVVQQLIRPKSDIKKHSRGKFIDSMRPNKNAGEFIVSHIISEFGGAR